MQYDLELVSLPIDTPIPADDNPRKIPEKAVAKLAKAMVEIGFTNPILLDENNVILAGHTRVMAARRAGFTEVPCRYLRGLSENQKQAVRISDNRLATETDFDRDLLSSALQALDAEGEDLSWLGFEPGELERLLDLSGAGEPGEDEVPEVPTRPRTVLGDIWHLGDHRLICGDATAAMDVTCLLYTSPSPRH